MSTELLQIAAGKRVIQQGDKLSDTLGAKLSFPDKTTLDKDAVERVREFQKAKSLTFKDGKVGPETISELAPEVAALGYKTMILRREKVLKQGMGKTESERVALRGVGEVLNRWMEKEGQEFSKDLKPVGDTFDENFKKSVQSFQRWAKTKDDGIVGENTLKALLKLTKDGEIPFVEEKKAAPPVETPKPAAADKKPEKRSLWHRLTNW